MTDGGGDGELDGAGDTKTMGSVGAGVVFVRDWKNDMRGAGSTDVNGTGSGSDEGFGVTDADGTAVRVATSTVIRGVGGLISDLPTRRACGVTTDGDGWIGGERTGMKRLSSPFGVRMEFLIAYGQGVVGQSYHLSF